MSNADLAPRPELFGRSSSHFTRMTRIFAAELGVEYTFRVVRDLLSTRPSDYGDNPALKLPTLRSTRGVWFGALNICRELQRMSRSTAVIAWPEATIDPIVSNAQELVFHAMSTDVTLVLAKLTPAPTSAAAQEKLLQSLTGSLRWLDAHATRALSSLPVCDLSVLEVSMFCLVTHLRFRELVPTAEYANLNALSDRFAIRPSAELTAYQFDVVTDPPA